MDEEYMDLFNRQPTPFAQIAIGSAQKATDYDVQNIEWASSKNFTVDLGMNQIEQYISTWEMHASWLHSIDYLQEESLEFSRRYHYRVKWSVPTRRKPVPRSTACVYFVIEVFTNKPENWPVQVYYFVESNRLLHRPGQSRFREKWLKDVIESKILLTEKITF
uniref:A-kinase anchoring protein 14 n=1 Tax=Erpetoichthys calabaricus TaxID=27687 RepID=A0A8C4SK47_ERPCA